MSRSLLTFGPTRPDGPEVDWNRATYEEGRTMTSVLPENRTINPSDWAGSPLSTVHRAAPGVHPIPIEQYPDGSSYVVRLELPGIDASGDLEVTVQTGILSVRAERRDQTPPAHDSEFRYGSYARHIALPLGSNVHDVTAVYRNGILTIRIGIEPEHDAGPHAVRVETP
jgi:HSP20 family protein